jgi:hypothetical protein
LAVDRPSRRDDQFCRRILTMVFRLEIMFGGAVVVIDGKSLILDLAGRQ